MDVNRRVGTTGKRRGCEKSFSDRISQISEYWQADTGISDHQQKHEKTRELIAKEHNVSDSYVRRAEYFAKGVDIAEESVTGTKQEILDGKIKPTDKEITAIIKTSPSERPEIVKNLSQEKRKNSRIENERIRKIVEKFEHLDLKSTTK